MGCVYGSQSGTESLMSMLTTPLNGRATTDASYIDFRHPRKVPHRSLHPEWVKPAGDVLSASPVAKDTLSRARSTSPSPNYAWELEALERAVTPSDADVMVARSVVLDMLAASGEPVLLAHAISRGDVGGHLGTMVDVGEVEVVVAHDQRATLRVDDVFLKIDSDQRLTDVEVEAMALAPIPTPEVLWRKPPVLALAAVPGTALGRLGEPSIASSAAWASAGAAARMLHDAPLPPWPGRSLDELGSRL